MLYLHKKLLRGLFQLLLVICFTSCNSTDKKNREQNEAKVDTYDTAELTIQRGMVLFNQHCASCHNFSENVIGPNLAGVTSEVSKEWLIDFIKNPKKSIESGDKRAVELYAKYKSYMPSFEVIRGKDLEDLLGFIHKFSEAEKRNVNNRPGGILNPIPEKIPDSDLTLIIEELLTVPSSSETAPKARINKLSALKTKEGERLFIADLRGKLYEVVGSEVNTFLDLKVEIENFIDNPGWGTGLGSFDFHPEFHSNGLLYTTHTEPSRIATADFELHDTISSKLQWVLTEWKMDEPSALYFSGKKREVLRVDMVTAAHGFQELTFNPLAKKGEPDYGLLYLGIGDGVAALRGYPFLCDNPGSIWGSVIRIDPTGKDSRNGKYGIPKDNPFVSDPDKLEEIWSYGFRNPHRISWDEADSGTIFVTNIGQHSLEEVNLLKKGANYGWPNREGTFLYDVNANTEIVYPLPKDDGEFSYPIIQYDHDEGNAISGGFTYNGSEIPLLKGKYIFGDIPRGTLFFSELSDISEGEQAEIYKLGLELNGRVTSFSEMEKGQRVDLRFGRNSSGELFIFTKSNGKVYEVVGCKNMSVSL
ncbi:c-type cytochrome [Maribacter algarum]|uniref:C-type cytochrome n=1 Tax=Maribacter algarum (ex Zhang et al. 2020) TaxID=2578118 RepID=A0A5S3PSY9_9FLAO|nr:PQQ-dependent sugar dehydrogenase [Maribacter algarum]TMM58063.1 c-type cytochrome [Maribacter algarum]